MIKFFNKLKNPFFSSVSLYSGPIFFPRNSSSVIKNLKWSSKIILKKPMIQFRENVWTEKPAKGPYFIWPFWLLPEVQSVKFNVISCQCYPSIAPENTKKKTEGFFFFFFFFLSYGKRKLNWNFILEFP